MRVVGIDPGTARIGYALLESGDHSPRLIRAETIILETKEESSHRLAKIHEALGERLMRDTPDVVALEKLFFQKNAKTAMAVAEARGVILLTAARSVRSIWEYTPLEVKMAVSGFGRSDKTEMRKMVSILLPGTVLPKHDDAVDAVAIALTAIATAHQRTQYE